jgi:His-Xaa-Ser system radical SAM maturase HxsC
VDHFYDAVLIIFGPLSVCRFHGAFDETIRGILNLKRCGVKVEIRVVLHKQTYERLPQLAEFITRNLLFVDHVALMGLEMTGFTKANLNELWIDPVEYQPQLVTAVETLSRFKMRVSVYNHQLCTLDERLLPYNVKSISDWKNEYMPECIPCTEKERCGGFFSSATLKYSAHIRPFLINAS